jgi:hypothetical protein
MVENISGLSEQRIRERLRLQSSSKLLLKGKEKYRHHKRENGGLWLDGIEVMMSLFKRQFINFKGKWQEKSRQSLQEGPG